MSFQVVATTLTKTLGLREFLLICYETDKLEIKKLIFFYYFLEGGKKRLINPLAEVFTYQTKWQKEISAHIAGSMFILITSSKASYVNSVT